ncbi:MAG: hypothetical protein H0T92_11625 [Pyrinomonadaceae bacterium]|nr:hypothetical protein [Pyrinomonadaceae bacterium]
MSEAKHSRITESKSAGSNSWLRRTGVYAGVLLTVFLLGLVPMWLTAREHARELDATRAILRTSQVQNTLANAVIDARRGEYEPSRQAASEFFTNLRSEIERGSNSAYSQSQQNNLRAVLANRDDMITLLARSDPSSADRLVELYNLYRQAMTTK